MIAAIAIFCEDIREEKSGQDTIVGTIPDNLNIAHATNLRPVPTRLAVYVRVAIGTSDQKPSQMVSKLINTDGNVIAQSEWEPSIIDKAFAEARRIGMPIVGFISRFVGNFPIAGPGQLTSTVTIDGVGYLAGAVNVIIPSPAIASGAPPERFPSGALPTP